MENAFTILRNVIVIFMILCFSCKKGKESFIDNPYGLPNATQTGSNIFACRVNDSNWITKVSSSTLHSSFRTNNGRDTLGLSGSGSSNRLLETIAFSIFDRIQTGKSYRVNDSTKGLVNTFRLFANCGQTSGYGGAQWNKAADGTITITKFTGTYTVPSCCTYGTFERNSIISGTFNFIIPIPNCDTIKVTEGRFDINYSQY